MLFFFLVTENLEMKRKVLCYSGLKCQSRDNPKFKDCYWISFVFYIDKVYAQRDVIKRHVLISVAFI